MAKALKDLYNDHFFEVLCTRVHLFDENFDSKAFMKDVYNSEWKQMELKARMRHIAHCLNDHVKGSFPKQVAVLEQAIGPGFGLEQMCFPDFVEVYGMEHPERSLEALYKMTPFSSAEFAIRQFILKEPEKVILKLYRWAEDENHHIRRLASEGCRPILPWAVALKDFQKDPSIVLPILEKLKNDPSEYVRRSVANNLNDISKNQPELVLEIAKDWLGKTPETDKLIKHACRGLLKKGNPKAMRLFGFADASKIAVKGIKITPNSIQIGDEAQLQFEIHSKAKGKTKTRLEYAIDYLKANGSLSRKVFFLSEKDTENGVFVLKRKLNFKNLSTRKHYPGEHRVIVLVNGEEKASLTFNLL